MREKSRDRNLAIDRYQQTNTTATEEATNKIMSQPMTSINDDKSGTLDDSENSTTTSSTTTTNHHNNNNNNTRASLQRTLYDSTLFHPYFDRQMRIPDWNQDVISSQVCLVLGIGGLGSTVASDLLRLGVKRIICVDHDKVETHNLNRQLLYTKNHVNLQKAECARQQLERDNLCSEIECHDLDAVLNWDKIVQFAKQCTVVFNMIDVGDYWDYAVQSLCLRYNLTFVSGGTFQTTVTVDYVHRGNVGACWSCLSDIKRDLLERLSIDNIDKLKDLSFIPEEEHPIGASACFVAAICGHLMVNRFVHALQLNEDREQLANLPNRIMFYLNTLEIDKWAVEKSADCPLCSQLQRGKPYGDSQQ